MSMVEDAGDGETQRRKLPKGFFRPGRMTTTADPVMRKEAKETLRKHGRDADEERESQ